MVRMPGGGSSEAASLPGTPFIKTAPLAKAAAGADSKRSSQIIHERIAFFNN